MPLEREAYQAAQVVDGEVVPVESQPAGTGRGGLRGRGGRGQVACLGQGQRAGAPGTSTSLAVSAIPGIARAAAASALDSAWGISRHG